MQNKHRERAIKRTSCKLQITRIALSYVDPRVYISLAGRYNELFFVVYGFDSGDISARWERESQASRAAAHFEHTLSCGQAGEI